MGAPIPQPYLAPTTRGSVLLNGVNYASGAGGILDSTGYNYVSQILYYTNESEPLSEENYVVTHCFINHHK